MRIENDKAIFKKGYPAIVPFLMEEYRGELSFEIYAGIKKIVLHFKKAYQGRYFTKDALAFIGDALDEYIETNGYLREKRGGTLYYYQYEMKEKEKVDLSLIGESTVRLTEKIAEKYGNLTTFSLQERLEKNLVSFVTLSDSKVVAIATVNETLEETSCLEVTVETAVAYRGKGYANSCVAALTYFLLEKGATVAYCCRNNHTKSNRIAKRVGFERVGRFFAVSAYRVYH